MAPRPRPGGADPSPGPRPHPTVVPFPDSDLDAVPAVEPVLDLERGDAYGRSFGDVYDRWYDGVTDAEATADFVVARHAGGPVLELGVGTGRLAAPLARRGLTVVGLDASADMLTRAPAGAVGSADPAGAVEPGDPGGARAGRVLPVLGDMRALPFRPGSADGAGAVGSVLVAFNTLFNLTTPEGQAALLRDLARLLDDRAPVIIEMLDVAVLVDGPDRAIGLRGRQVDPLVVTATTLDRSAQLLNGRHLEITDGGIRVRPWLLRWATADQLDAMAEAAGLRLDERLGSWSGAPADHDGATVISVYRRTR